MAQHWEGRQHPVSPWTAGLDTWPWSEHVLQMAVPSPTHPKTWL